MRVLALICARSGSKGLPDKNVRELNGIPLLARAVDLARSSVRGSERWRILVSTDSPRYERIALAAGAEVARRPRRLATDEARLIDVVLHTIADTPCDVVVLLSATTPLTAAADVRRVITTWRRERVGIATICEDTPASLRFALAGKRLVASGNKPPGRRQEDPPSWRLNGAVYAASPSWLAKHRRFVVAGKSIGVAMPKRRSIDIDDAEDLAMATSLANHLGPAYPVKY